DAGSDRLQSLDLSPQGYHLVVARFEPENHVLEIVKGYAASSARLPLVVVGSAPYADRYTVQIQDAAGSDPRIRMLGGVWDQKQLDQLYANAFSYLHGHSVGGTNPSLLRAMGAGTAVIGFDVSFNREVLGNIGGFFTGPDDLAALVEQAERHPEVVRSQAQAVQQRASSVYRWDDVAVGYEALLHQLHREHGKRPSSAPPRRLRAVRPVASSNGTRRGES
ncbi:MAG TPA: glycosyltransferase, partial [Microlunatus sp.]